MALFSLHLLLMATSLPVQMGLAQGPGPTSILEPTPVSWPSMPNIPTDFGNISSSELRDEYCQSLSPNTPLNDLPWFCMCNRCTAKNKGPKGDTGDRGLRGRPGSFGGRGLSGPPGPPGSVGRPGIKGQKGIMGEKGRRGLFGAAGIRGIAGFKGDKGDVGMGGYPGHQGPKGDEGECPEICESSIGPPGPPGLPGPAGSRGLAGRKGDKGLRGQKGELGVLGPNGVPGPNGLRGDLGLPGDCNCVDGRDGPLGAKGDNGNRGRQGNNGPAGQIGTQGIPGIPGTMGPVGLPGPCTPGVQSAFAVGLAISYPPPNTPIVFQNIYYNIQGNYNTALGIYTAPTAGTYVFSYHVSIDVRIVKVGLFVNYVPMVKTTDKKLRGTASQSVLLHLVEGDRVWMQVKDSLSNGLYVSAEANNIFSGYLLHPDSCDMPIFRSHSGTPKQTSSPDHPYDWGVIAINATATPTAASG